MQVFSKQLSGLGNQLFQYAAGCYFAERYRGNLTILQEPSVGVLSYGEYNRPFLLSQFQIAAPHRMTNLWDHSLMRRGPRWVRVTAPLKSLAHIAVRYEQPEKHGRFIEDLDLPPGTRTLYISGYWQAYQYADAVAPRLRKDFRLREPAQGNNRRFLEQIQSAQVPVSLHVRRGDYATEAEGNIVLRVDYYRRAIELIRLRFTNPKFFIFSDDLEFARESLPADIDRVFVEGNDDFSSHEDLRLMSACRHHIIANSSFSWWGAWLNSDPGKTVVAPRHWRLTADTAYPDLIPPSWLAIDTLRDGESAAQQG